MDNYSCCKNVLRLYGAIKEINRFIIQGCAIYVYVEEEILTTDLSLEMFLPVPKEIKNAQKPGVEMSAALIVKYRSDVLHDWCMDNWGVEMDILAYKEDDDTFNFDTKRAPPIKAIVAISRQFPGLSFFLSYENFRYEYQALADFGKLVIRNGRIKYEVHKEKVKCVFKPACHSVTGHSRELLMEDESERECEDSESSHENDKKQ